jgi:hypothetical protein
MTATITELETIEHLDFQPELPCEHSNHEYGHVPHRPAAYLIWGHTSCCGQNREFLLCERGWQLGGRGVMCSRCGAVYPREQVWTILKVL